MKRSGSPMFARFFIRILLDHNYFELREVGEPGQAARSNDSRTASVSRTVIKYYAFSYTNPGANRD